MLVYLVRQFTFDQVNHVAKYRNPKKAVKLDPKICKNLGIGNSTGLGMAPFIVNHPTLLNNWIICRETALKKIREIKKVETQDSDLFKNCVKNSIKNITSWNTESDYQLKKIKSLLKDVRKFLDFVENKFNFKIDYPFNEIYFWLEKETCEECIEYIVSIMMEPYGKIIDPLVKEMSSDEEKYFNIPTNRTVAELKTIREIKDVKTEDSDLFKIYLKKSIKNITSWNTDSEYQQKKIKSLLDDLNKFIQFLENDLNFLKEFAFNNIYLWAEENLGEECIEYIISMMMEPYDEIVNPLINQMSSEEEKYFNIPTDRTIGELRKILEKKYSEIIKIDFSKKENYQNFWFISKNNEEPRMADRFNENGSELEQPLAIARDIKKLYEVISAAKNSSTIDKFLLNNNDLRHVVRRAFIVEKFPYSEIQDNTIGQSIIPIDMLRLKLSFFGALKFDPRSDKWLRICMFQGAPLPHELKNYNPYWVYNSLN